ncbi:MAG: hypothetical protein H0X36_01235 [Sphingomonadaceae bacterium]|nr:hypothetical protein [Sphingomonadaceae bacterium]
MRVSRAVGGFRVDDGGFAFREIDQIGFARSFPSEAKKVAEPEGLCFDRRLIFVDCAPEELSRRICDVAAASCDLTERLVRRVAEREEAELEDGLRERLVRVFGTSHLDESQDIVGSSTIKWSVSAIVRIERDVIIYQAVSTHANSVNKASTAFHDLLQLPHPPLRVAVVKDKNQLGSKLALLAQAGRVIQSDQPDDIYRAAAQ